MNQNIPPKVTVLMPVYNASLFLAEAIESILNQTLKEFEFLIMDDGSIDNSTEIIRRYDDPRIRLITNEKNLGISATLNHGISIATCDLIARMDADDISYPDRLQKQYDYMVSHPECALLSTWARVITPEKQLVTLEKHPGEFYYYNLNFECWIYHPTVMYRKEAVQRFGMYSKVYSEDYDLFWRISRECIIRNLDEALVDYRLSPQSLNTVLRKTEYELANRENVIRNLQYYMGKDFWPSDECLECLRHNFAPILALNRIEPLLECLDLLDRITRTITQTPNVNRDVSALRRASHYKKTFIVDQLFQQIPGFRKFEFILKSRSTEVLLWKIEKSLRWRFNSVKQHFKPTNNH